MDALVDLDIAELELLMETQNQTPDSFVFQGDNGTFTPELFLSNAGTSYAPDADPFETEWLAIQLAPDTLVSGGDAAKSDSVFTEDEIIVPGTQTPSGGGGFAGFISGFGALAIQAQLDANDNAGPEDEIIVPGTRTTDSTPIQRTPENTGNFDFISNLVGTDIDEMFVFGTRNVSDGDSDNPAERGLFQFLIDLLSGEISFEELQNMQPNDVFCDIAVPATSGASLLTGTVATISILLGGPVVLLTFVIIGSTVVASASYVADQACDAAVS